MDDCRVSVLVFKQIIENDKFHSFEEVQKLASDICDLLKSLINKADMFCFYGCAASS